jgi:NDP-sugar pyrophosphorylase family protein
MAVTTFIDDERPLYVTTIDDGKTIDSFTDDAPQHPHYVSAGIYAMRPTILPVLAQCIANGYSLRQFQQALVDNGLRLCAYDLGTVIDVDHVSDIATANKYVSQWQKSSTQNTIQK